MEFASNQVIAGKPTQHNHNSALATHSKNQVTIADFVARALA